MRIVPIKLARPAVKRARLQLAIIDAGDRSYLAVIAGAEDLVRRLEVAIAQRGLDHGGADVPQQRDDAPARNAR